MNKIVESVAILAYVAGWIWTFIYLTFLDDITYTWWNWIIAIPMHLFLASIWPMYWAILHWLF